MKILIATILMAFNANVFTAEKLEKGLYIPTDGTPCAYQVYNQTDDKVFVTFSKNPTNIIDPTCAVGMNYPISVEIVDNQTFIDLRTNKKFILYKKTKLKLGLYVPEDGDYCAYQVVKQTNNGIVIIFRKNPDTMMKSNMCAVGVDYPISVSILDKKSFVDLRTQRVFKYFSEY